MAKGNPQRELVEPGIYIRRDAHGRDIFEVSFRDAQGHQRRKKVKGGITAARSALKAAHVARDRHEPVPADPRLKFGAVADLWWQARATSLRPTTQSAYGACLKHLRARFGNARLTDITPAEVAAFVRAQRRVERRNRKGELVGTGLKGWTIKGQLTVLSAVYKYASRHLGYVGANPVSLLDRVERPSSDDERSKRVLTGGELARLLAAVDGPYRLIFELTAETGARLGETLGLVWGEVDLEAETVTFTHQLDRNGKRVPLKTRRSRRCVEVTPGLIGKLREAKMAARRGGAHDLVFVSRAGTPHDHRNVAGRVLTRAVKRAGLEPIKRDGQVVEHAPTFHSLRHSHGSALIAAGWDIEEVSAQLGHANIATTQRIYVHAYDAARRSEERRKRLAALYVGDQPTAEASVTELHRS
jgi:integrase